MTHIILSFCLNVRNCFCYLGKKRSGTCVKTFKISLCFDKFYRDLYCMFTCIYSCLIDKDLCESRNISIKFPCVILVYLCFSSGDLFIFSLRVNPFLFLLVSYTYFGIFCFHVVSFVFLHIFSFFYVLLYFLFFPVHESILPQTIQASFFLFLLCIHIH